MEEGKEGGRNRFESWLAVEAAAQRTGGSPGLSPGIENPSRQDGVHRRTREPGPEVLFQVKAMAFPIVMYGCESRTIKKAECQRIDAFELCVGEDS